MVYILVVMDTVVADNIAAVDNVADSDKNKPNNAAAAVAVLSARSGAVSKKYPVETVTKLKAPVVTVTKLKAPVVLETK